MHPQHIFFEEYRLHVQFALYVLNFSNISNIMLVLCPNEKCFFYCHSHYVLMETKWGHFRPVFCILKQREHVPSVLTRKLQDYPRDAF